MHRSVKLLAAAAVLLLAVYLGRVDRASHYRHLPPPARGPWVAFGDSLTEGYGAAEGHSYPALLGERLGLTIQNHGVSGDTTGDGLSRLENVAQMHPRVVLLCLGGNDGLRQLSREQMFSNLALMIDRFQQGGAFVVLLGIRSVGLRDHNEKHFRQLARDKQVLYVPDILDGIMFRPGLMSDALHPNDAGYGKIAERIALVLGPLLPQLKGAPSGP